MKISIAMTTYNGGKYLREQLDSLWKQTLPADEIIICDDGSDDETRQILKEFSKLQSEQVEIKIVENEENLGWKLNFRKAMQMCTGDYIFLSDQDDIWELSKIQEMTSVMQKNKDILLLASNYSLMIEDNSENKKLPSEVRSNTGKVKKINKFRYYGNVLRPGCTFCFRKEMLEMIRRNDNRDYGHDCILWHIALAKDSLWIYEKVLLRQRLHAEHSSRPTEEIGISRRMGEISRKITMCEYTNQVYNSEKGKNLVMADKMRTYYSKRYSLLKERKVPAAFFYNIANANKAPSVRAVMGDFYVLLKSKA